MVSDLAAKLREQRKKIAEKRNNKNINRRKVHKPEINLTQAKKNIKSKLKYNTKTNSKNKSDRKSANCSHFSNTVSTSEYLNCHTSGKHCECFKRMRACQAANTKSRKRESALRRKISKLKGLLANKDKCVRVWKQKYHRSMKKLETTPEKNVQKIMRLGESAVKKRLMFCEVLEKQLKDNKNKAVSQKEKTIYSRIIAGKIVRKYRCSRRLSTLVSMYQQRTNQHSATLQCNRAKKQFIASNIIKQFFERSDNSALAPGKKDVITKCGKMFRKRYLQHSPKDLYEKFRSETGIVISLSTFLKYRPFWIVKQKMSARNTCLCKMHENFDLILKKACQVKVLPTSSSRKFTSLVTCDSNAKTCMFRECTECKNKLINMPTNPLSQTFYYQWCLKSITRKGSKNLMYNVKLTSKTLIECNIKDLVDVLNSKTELYLKHVYSTGHQLKFIEDLKLHLEYKEVFVVIDFSENYLCKYNSEIQSVHFGASKKQISLHTGAFFIEI